MDLDPLPNTPHISPVNITDANDGQLETNIALGPLSSFTGAYSSRSRARLSNFSGISFTSDDFRRLPQDAENMEFQTVGPNQISMVRVPSKLEHVGERSKWKKERAGKEEDQELELELEPASEPPKEPKEIVAILEITERPSAEIQVNGESYLLHEDGVFRPIDLCMSAKVHFKGYAVRANGLFKPLGGSPAAIEASTLYRVTPTNKFSYTKEGQDCDSKALHRIKSVQQLLVRGTSGHEEYMYAYDQHWEGFIRTEEKCRFPPEKAMLKPGNLRSTIHTQDSEDLFTSADDALRKAAREEEITNSGGHISPVVRSLTVPPSRVHESSLPKGSQTPDIFTNSIKEQVVRFDEQLQGSWLNIDVPSQQGSPIPPSAAIGKAKGENVHTLSPVAEMGPFLAPATNVFPINDMMGDLSSNDGFIIQSPQVSPMTTAFHKPIKRVLGAGVPETSAPTIEQPVNECVLVICLHGNQRSSCARLGRISIPNVGSADFDDMDLFFKMREEYDKLRGFWRQWLSLRGVKRIDLIECGRTQRHVYPTSFRADIFSPGKLLESYLNPCKVVGDHYWVEWVHRLCSNDDRYALEFVEGWKSGKILVAGATPIALSISGEILWCFFGPEQEYLVALVLGISVIIVGWSVVGLFAVLSYTV